MVDNICGQGEETVNGGQYFHVQIKQSCKSERLVVFFWYGRDQMGPGGAEFLTMRGVLLLIRGIGGGY